LHSACFSPSAPSASRSSAFGVSEGVVGCDELDGVSDPPDDPPDDPRPAPAFTVFSAPEEDGESVETARVSGRAPRADRRDGRALDRCRAA